MKDVHFIRRFLTRLGAASAHPAAFLIVAIYVVAWWAFEPDTLDWHAYATIATWLMTLLIQRSEHRDTQALHAKLDELLHVEGKACNRLTRLDDKEPEEIERFRDEVRAAD